MTSPAPVARLTTPAEFVAMVPMLTGFVPRESAVVVSLRPPRKRIGLTMRFDLPPPGLAGALADEVADRLAEDGAAAALLVVYTEAAGRLPEQGLVERVEDACGVPLEDALLVRGGRWWSYHCTRASCCPPDGTSLETAPSPALELVAAENALDGRAVLPSRDDLVRSVAPPTFLAEQAALQRLDAAADAWLAAVGRDPEQARGQALPAARLLLEQVAEGATPDPPDVAALAVAVHDVLVRDEISTWMLDRPAETLALLLQVARQVPPPYDAPICTMLAWVAYGGGNGALANVALDRAMGTDPEYSLAVLLRSALDRQVPPAEVRGILRDTAAVLARKGPKRRRSRR
jgi:hypothetical protein